MAQLAKHGGLTIQLERSGTLIAEHAPPQPPQKMDYPNERASLAVFRKRIAQLVADNWHLRYGDSDIGSPVARDPRVEAELVEAPDPDRHAVYRDWLIENGDPCGELAALRVHDAPTAELEAARGYELFGIFAEAVAALPHQRNAVTFAWRDGWIDGFELRGLDHSALLALALHAPMARFVRRLVVRAGCFLPNLSYALANCERRTAIRELETDVSNVAASLLDNLPDLDSLITTSTETAIGHPRVRSLTVMLRRSRGLLLLDGAWPALERLTICAPKLVGAEIAPIIEAAPFERLRALRHVDLDADLDAESYDAIRTRLRGFST